MSTEDWLGLLPAINAGLNGLATVLLLVGYGFIRQYKTRAHAWTMLTAFATSVVFLVCYLAYHTLLHQVTGQSGRPFQGTGWIRPVYFTILISHVVLAAAVPILALMTIYRGLTRQWERHRSIARVTLPIWLYVSVTGVIIYGMLYHLPT